MIRAAYQIQEQGIALPILIGDEDEIKQTSANLGLDFDPTVADPTVGDYEEYADRLHEPARARGSRGAKPANSSNTIPTTSAA